MKTKYCLPIIKISRKEVLQSLRIKDYDFYEIWLDYIKDLDEKFINEICKKFQRRLIFVFRRQNLEKIKLDLEKRQKFITLLSRFNVYLDLDFLTQHEELEFLISKAGKIKLILSYHNYKETPKLDFLGNLLNKMKRYNPNMYKIATFCQKESDALILLSFILILKEQKLNYIILGMGKNGQATRIIGPLWGNQISFTPKEIKEKSALGQLTKDQLEKILNIIN